MLKKISLIFIIFVLLSACSSDKTEEPEGVTDNFERQAMLAHLADDIIIPAFEDFQTKINTVSVASNIFVASPSETSLSSLKTAWLDAYKTWQYVEMFNIGKAEELQFVNFINIYPVTVSDVENNIASGIYDLGSTNNHDAQGLPAIDYLLYGIAEDDIAVLAKYTTDQNAAGYKTYLTDVITKITDITTDIVADWNGTYRDEFVNSSDNTATSSLNKLVNDYVFYYEKGLRANKIGTPAGVFSTDPLPEKVEAFYNQEVSKELFIEGLTAVKDFFNGKSYNATTEELGFKAYLEFLEQDALITAITEQLDTATTLVDDLDTNFHEQIVTDNVKMLNAYDELQRVVPYFKSDMLQAFNISVDFVDADGD